MEFTNWQDGKCLTVWLSESQAVYSAARRANETGREVVVMWKYGYGSGIYRRIQPYNLKKT